MQLVVNSNQAESPDGEFHPPELPSNEEGHVATVSAGTTVVGRVMIVKMGHMNCSLNWQALKPPQGFTS